MVFLFQSWFVFSGVGQHRLDLLLKRAVDHVVVAHAANALAGLFLHAVLTTGLGAADAAFPRDLEALRVAAFLTAFMGPSSL